MDLFDVQTQSTRPFCEGYYASIGSIPQNLLVDPNGKIIAKNVEGMDLAEKLGEIIANGETQSSKTNK
jgi:hypothetical protein